jgi:hypothetical protein
MRLRALPDIFTSDSFQHSLVTRTDRRAIYRKTKPKIGYTGFEVIQIRLVKPHPKDETACALFDWVEVYPGNERWGIDAWSYGTLEEAHKRYSNLPA